MKTRTAHRTDAPASALLALAAGSLALACSSGLEGAGGLGPSENVPVTVESTNGRFGFDPCVALTDPITDMEVTGGVIPLSAGSGERPVAFVTFVTRTQMVDADDGTTDTNGVADVFVAAVDCDSVDPRAFTHGMVSAMRHVRCVTCHQMNLPQTNDPAPTPFLTQPHFAGGGLPPLNLFTDGTCRDCHFEDWLAPGPTFDLRVVTTNDLFIRAQVPPVGMIKHFTTDPRVLWALDSAATPFGGAADDDHDGIDEPEDTDGTRRRVPGGKKRFLERLAALQETADPQTGELKFSSAPDALHDVVLASRRYLVNEASNGASTAASTIYQPNAGFDPNNPTASPAGFLHVAFQSDGTNLVGGNGNGFSDVFRADIEVRVLANGRLDLSYVTGSQFHVSQAAGGGDASGDSTDPVVGANGQRVAFLSSAFDLVPGLPTTCRPEAYLWHMGTGTQLVSKPQGMALPGDAGAAGVDLSDDGMVVLFESDATNLVPGDTNGARDVFYAVWPALTVERASVDELGGEFAGHATAGSVSHAAGDVRVAFAVQDTPLPPVQAVQCPAMIALPPITQDAHIRETAATSNFGGLGSLYTGRTGTAGFGFARSLLQFDVSSIPAGSTINSVELTMTVTSVPNGTGASCGANGIPNNASLRRVLAAWSENQVTWNQRLTGVNWAPAGGQFSGTSSATTQLTGTGSYMWSGAGMAADVESWVNSGNNFGWLVEGTNANCSMKILSSREGGASPSLVVDYTPPILRAPFVAAVNQSRVYVRDVTTARTFDLNRAVTPEGTIVANEFEPTGAPLDANARTPVINAEGTAVLFESSAQNLEVVRPLDENRAPDIVLSDLSQLDTMGLVLPYTLSITVDGGSANGPSHSPRFGSFNPPTDAFPLGIAMYATQATNLGNSDPGDLDGNGRIEGGELNLMLNFLSEGASTIANFEAQPARQGMNRGVLFHSLSSGEPTQFLWDFGDGTTSTAKAPVHVYDTPGFYDVSLTVNGPRGTDDRTRTQYVHVLDAVTADFNTTKDITLAPAQDAASFMNVPFGMPVIGAIDDADPGSILRLDLDGSASTEFPDTYRWFLRRTQPPGARLLVAEGAAPQDVPIDRVGLYDLTLEATGAGGLGSATQLVEVYQKVEASFTASPGGSLVRGPAPFQVQFTDTSTGDLVDVNAHDWDFDDGNSSTLADPMNTFAEGTYFVTLSVEGKGTDSDTSAPMPVVSDGPVTALFSIDPQPADSVSGILNGAVIDSGGGALVNFTNLSANQALAPMFFRWDFGIGATGQEQTPDPSDINYIADPENVTSVPVSLVTSTINPAPANCLGAPAGTCNQSAPALLTVYPRPTAAVNPAGPSFKLTPLRPAHTVNLSATVTGDGTGTDPTYRWLRSEANQTGATIEIASGPGLLNLQYEFADAGDYEVCVEVSTNGPTGRQTVTSAPQTVTVTASTLTEWINQAVQATGARCRNCHSGANPPAGLNWEGTPSDIFSRIVDVRSQNCNPSRDRIEPFDPENSVVYNVLSNPSGPLCAINMRINLPGDEVDKDAHLAVLRSWITGGALNN